MLCFTSLLYLSLPRPALIPLSRYIVIIHFSLSQSPLFSACHVVSCDVWGPLSDKFCVLSHSHEPSHPQVVTRTCAVTCPGRAFVFRATTAIMSALLSAVDWSKPSLLISIAAITFNPTAWNIVARNGMRDSTFGHRDSCSSETTEFHHKTITKLFGGNARNGCYFLAVMIFSFGILRDRLCVYRQLVPI